MDRGRKAMPVASKICSKSNHDRARRIHAYKLNNIRSSVDTKPPKQHKHLKNNRKKEQMMEERFAKIERENRILLEKMSTIMRNNTLDNVNQSSKFSHSLNKAQRKKELAK